MATTLPHSVRTIPRAKRVHVVFPPELIARIDAKEGKSERTKAIITMVEEQMEQRERAEKQRRFLEYLQSGEPIWKDEDHPEIKQYEDPRFPGSSYGWIRHMRDEGNKRWEAKMSKRYPDRYGETAGKGKTVKRRKK